MRAFKDIASGAGGSAITIAAIFILFWQIYLLVFALSPRRRPAAVILCAAGALSGAAFLTFLLDGIYTLDYLPYRREYSAVTTALYSLPWLYLLLAVLFFAAVCALCSVYFARRRRREMSLYSIKEALDYLPVGVCIGASDGSALLTNIKMNEVFGDIAGRQLTDTGELAEIFSDSSSRIFATDKNAYVFTRGEFRINGRIYSETTLEDQTEQYRKTRELEEKNARLRDLQVRLKEYRVRDEDLLIRRELLEARKTVHNELGAALLTGKYSFEHPENVDRKEFLGMMRYINAYLLAEAEEPDDARDEYAAALRIARRIGVRVAENGEAPRDEPYRSVVGLAVGECAANTVKHAGGNEVCVSFGEENGLRRAVITNNGDPPGGEIRETGGLLSLRSEAEAVGMEMKIESRPSFSLSLRFPPEKNV